MTVEILRFAALAAGKSLYQPLLVFPGNIILREEMHEGRTTFDNEDQAKARGDVLRNTLALGAQAQS